MNTSVRTAHPLTAAHGDGRAYEALAELAAAMPIVIFYRAVREVFRRRAHRRAVLDAFRR